MIKVVDQSQTNTYLIEYYHLDEREDGWHMIALARYNLEETGLVDLGTYKYYRQAIEVFAQLDYNANDLMYYRTQEKIFYMPENILDEKELNILYPISPF